MTAVTPVGDKRTITHWRRPRQANTAAGRDGRSSFTSNQPMDDVEECGPRVVRKASVVSCQLSVVSLQSSGFGFWNFYFSISVFAVHSWPLGSLPRIVPVHSSARMGRWTMWRSLRRAWMQKFSVFGLWSLVFSLWSSAFRLYPLSFSLQFTVFVTSSQLS